MSRCVLDCSVVAGWCFEDEKDRWGDQVLDLVVAHGARVPSHWSLEVVNMLVQAKKRQRIREFEIVQRLQWLSDLSISVDDRTHAHAFRNIHVHAQQEGLTSYDAAYLDLALREGLPLATRDQDLKKACTRLGVACL